MAATMQSRALVQASVADPVRLDAEHFELVACRRSGAWYVRDKATGELFAGGRPMGEPASVEAKGQSLRIRFKEQAAVLVFHALPSGRDLELSVEGRGQPVLREGLWLAADEPGCFVVPQGEGWLLRAGQKAKHRFLSHQGRSHLTMQMLGLVRGEAALLLSWSDVGGCVDLATLEPGDKLPLRTALGFSGTPQLRLRVCGKGDYFTVVTHYRELAREKGLLVPFAERVKSDPALAKMAGAFDIKLWMKSGYKANCRFSKDPTKDQFKVHRTFDDALDEVRHLHDDLGFRRGLVVLAGWIKGGYDFSHPDIWPPDDDLGGPAGLGRVAKFTQGCGFLFGLHDNYDMMFKAQPSANPAEAIGEHNSWAGGPQYILHPKAQAKYARRNLELIRTVCQPDAYFTDQTMAVGLYATGRRELPLSHAECIEVYRDLIRAVKSLAGLWGSEDGQEWAVPVGDYHEGILSRDFYPRIGEPIPLFDLVYHDAAATFWHQGMTISLAERRHQWGRDCAAPEHYLELLSLARTPLFRPPGRHWWKEQMALPAQPGASPRRVLPLGSGAAFAATKVSCGGVERSAVFAHPPWQGLRGATRGEYPVQLPDAEGLALTFAVGLRDGIEVTDGVRFRVEVDGKAVFERLWGVAQWSAARVDLAPFRGRKVAIALVTDPHGNSNFDWAAWGEPRVVVGDKTLYDFAEKIGEAKTTMVELPAGRDVATNLFARADNGWAEGMHPLDAAVKNIYEFTSPTSELAFFLPITRYERRADGLVLSVFGDGAVEVAVNLGRDGVEHAGAVLPPRSGFIVRAPTFLAFHASAYQGTAYAPTALFTVRSLDGQPIERSTKLRVFHGFGPSKLVLTTSRVAEGKLTVDVTREAIIEPK
ncbi:MAG TPA: DUF5696 domain-containing protein [Planctomycetota bacterium]|nr:DUF5696 domain-containing protein [Planctomycetota bacterium]